jgi:hypothetical protein
MAYHCSDGGKQTVAGTRQTAAPWLTAELRGFIDRVIVPALVERFLRRESTKDRQVPVGDLTPDAVVSDVVVSSADQ